MGEGRAARRQAGWVIAADPPTHSSGLEQCPRPRRRAAAYRTEPGRCVPKAVTEGRAPRNGDPERRTRQAIARDDPSSSGLLAGADRARDRDASRRDPSLALAQHRSRSLQHQGCGEPGTDESRAALQAAENRKGTGDYATRLRGRRTAPPQARAGRGIVEAWCTPEQR